MEIFAEFSATCFRGFSFGDVPKELHGHLDATKTFVQAPVVGVYGDYLKVNFRGESAIPKENITKIILRYSKEDK